MRIEAGRWKGRKLPAVSAGGDARPVGARLKKSLFSVLEPRLEGARVLDLFAGVGGLGLEALSRGAAAVVLVDRDPRAVEALRRWADAAGASAEIRAERVDLSRRPPPEGPFDLVFLDPPFDLWRDGGDRAGVEDLPRALLEAAVGRLAPQGLLVLKLPVQASVPKSSAWRETRRREVGTAAWALVERAVPGADPEPN